MQSTNTDTTMQGRKQIIISCTWNLKTPLEELGGSVFNLLTASEILSSPCSSVKAGGRVRVMQVSTTKSPSSQSIISSTSITGPSNLRPSTTLEPELRRRSIELKWRKPLILVRNVRGGDGFGMPSDFVSRCFEIEDSVEKLFVKCTWWAFTARVNGCICLRDNEMFWRKKMDESINSHELKELKSVSY